MYKRTYEYVNVDIPMNFIFLLLTPINISGILFLQMVLTNNSFVCTVNEHDQ